MKNMKRLPILLMACALLAGLISCGGHGQLEKAVRSVMVSGDTTRAAYDSLCAMVTENPGKYGDLLTPEGKVDHKKMSDFIEQIVDIAKAAKPMNDFLNYTFEEYGELLLSWAFSGFHI